MFDAGLIREILKNPAYIGEIAFERMTLEKVHGTRNEYEHVNKGKDTRTHLLSGIVKCPICGVGMYGNKCIKKKST